MVLTVAMLPARTLCRAARCSCFKACTNEPRVLFTTLACGNTLLYSVRDSLQDKDIVYSIVNVTDPSLSFTTIDKACAAGAATKCHPSLKLLDVRELANAHSLGCTADHELAGVL